MKLTICRLDASFFLTERTVSWIMQSMTSFINEVTREDLATSGLGSSTAYAYYARAAYESSRNASNLVFDFDKRFIFSPDRDTVGGMDNPNTLSSWCRLMGFLYDDDGTFALGEFAKKYIATNRINTKELCLAIIAKQWIVVDGQCSRSLLSVIFELLRDSSTFLPDLSEYSSGNTQEDKDRKTRLQNAFFKQITGKDATDSDEIQFSRFDALRNTLLLAGLLSSDMNGKVFVSKCGAEIFNDFHTHEDRLSKFDTRKVNNKEKDFHRYMSSVNNGFFDIVKEDNAAIYKSYPNLLKIRHSNMCDQSNTKLPIQRIYYGAPGTGKSNEIKRITGNGEQEGIFSKDFTFRITLHPDSDYSSFVGAYKPVWDKSQQKIIYDFRPQSFLKAYIAAWSHPSKSVALIIEEINRGNCAQVFGDVFQLLDREAIGLSKYPIEADIDMKEFISTAFSGEMTEPWAGAIPDDEKTSVDEYYSAHYENAFEKIKTGEIIALPKNLSILATMNTSDQSLFPMDSAFKRRWEWIYQPIIKGVDSSTGAPLEWKIKVKGYQPIDWWEFLQRVNQVISDLTTSEDKQLGYFFCIPDEKASEADNAPSLISSKRFVGKVIFYLWNDVFKDYAFDTPCCKDENEKEVLFAQFYEGDGSTINNRVLSHFFDTLKNGSEASLLNAIVQQGDTNDSNNTSEEVVEETPDTTPNPDGE